MREDREPAPVINMLYQVALIAVLIPCVLSAIPVSPMSQEEFAPPKPYTFGYKVHDKDGDQWRSEASDGQGKIEGSYGYVDNLGMKREVHYIADDSGFRANIKTNEPGMDIPNPADVVMNASPPSDYDANIYGIEAVNPGMGSSVQEMINQEIRAKTAVMPSNMDSKGFYKYHRFAEPAVPPIYVVDGHLQSPWFPMNAQL